MNGFVGSMIFYSLNHFFVFVMKMNCDGKNSSEELSIVPLPEKPEEPAQSDCCGSGCTPCVFDIYEQELKIWERECQRLQTNNQNIPTKKLHPDVYTHFEIESLKEEAEDCIKLRFKLPHGASLGLGIGQHVIMRGWSGSKSVTRQYTPIYPTGKMSQITKQWKVGDKVEFRGPFGNFDYKQNKYKKMVCLAAGTGIAPMIQVIRFVLDNDEDETRIHLLYSVKKYSHILMKHLLDEWTGYWNFTCTYFLSQQKEEDEVAYRYGDKIQFFPVNKDIIQSILISDKEKTVVLICGTLTYDRDMLDFVQGAGISKCNAHKF